MRNPWRAGAQKRAQLYLYTSRSRRSARKVEGSIAARRPLAIRQLAPSAMSTGSPRAGSMSGATTARPSMGRGCRRRTRLPLSAMAQGS